MTKVEIERLIFNTIRIFNNISIVALTPAPHASHFRDYTEHKLLRRYNCHRQLTDKWPILIKFMLGINILCGGTLLDNR